MCLSVCLSVCCVCRYLNSSLQNDEKKTSFRIRKLPIRIVIKIMNVEESVSNMNIEFVVGGK